MTGQRRRAAPIHVAGATGSGEVAAGIDGEHADEVLVGVDHQLGGG
jgi:hypothetical protein